MDWPEGSPFAKTAGPLLHKPQGRRARTASSSSSFSYSSVPRGIILYIWAETTTSDFSLAFFGLGSLWEAEARERLGAACWVLLVGCFSVAPALDYDIETAPALLVSLVVSFSASFLASWYSVILRIRQPLDPTLALYVDLMPFMYEVFIPNPGTLFAMKYHVQKSN